MRPIIRWSIWDRQWSIVGWTVGLSAFIALNILVYQSISGQAKALNEALNNLPPAAQALFGSSGDFLSPIGYLNSKLYYLFLPLMFTILAISLARHLLSREEESGTLELLLARPISRAKFLLAKLTTAGYVMLAVAVDSLIITILSAWAIDYEIAIMRLVEATGLSLLISVLFGSIAWMFICLGRLGKSASIGAAGGVFLASYLFSSLSGFAGWLEWPAKLLPYHYYHPVAVLQGDYNWWNAVGMAIATLVVLIIAFIGFRRRDLG